MKTHNQRLERAQAAIGPKLRRLVEHQQRQLLAQLGGQHEPLPPGELADIRRALDNAPAELESAARTLESAGRALQGPRVKRED